MLFFVLSGFVLGLAIRRADQEAFGKEFVKFTDAADFADLSRVSGGYAPHHTLFLFSCHPIGVTPHLRGFTDHHPGSITLASVIQNLLFLSHSFNAVTWSLKTEILGSLALPFLHFLSKRLPD